MTEINFQNAASGNIQHLVIDGCTYEIHSIFGIKIKLEEIIAKRVHRDLNEPKFEDTTCFPPDKERSCLGK